MQCRSPPVSQEFQKSLPVDHPCSLENHLLRSEHSCLGKEESMTYQERVVYDQGTLGHFLSSFQEALQKYNPQTTCQSLDHSPFQARSAQALCTNE